MKGFFFQDLGSGIGQSGVRKDFFLNMVLRDEEILPTQNEQFFVALLFLDSDSCQSNAQKHTRGVAHFE